jgi:hypothetical protein
MKYLHVYTTKEEDCKQTCLIYRILISVILLVCLLQILMELLQSLGHILLKFKCQIQMKIVVSVVKSCRHQLVLLRTCQPLWCLSWTSVITCFTNPAWMQCMRVEQRYVCHFMVAGLGTQVACNATSLVDKAFITQWWLLVPYSWVVDYNIFVTWIIC